jgi:oxygen-dependent protoporphyrinogen oxidase
VNGPRPPRIVVVGGGIAGLTAGWLMRGLARVTVIESAPWLGGKLRRSELGGLPVDEGAESFLTRAPEGLDLVAALGLSEELIRPATTAAGVWTRGRVRRLPPRTLLGIPADLPALADSEVLSPWGTLRAAADLLWPPTPCRDDVAVGQLVARRLGREVVDRLVDPLLGGVYAGRAELLSLQATVPQLADAAAAGGSLVRAAGRALAAGAGSVGSGPVPEPASPTPVFATLRGGLAVLAERLAAELRAAGAQLMVGRPVRELRRGPDGWTLVVGSTRSPERLDAERVVLALPAAPAARLLRPLSPAAAADLSAIDYASVAIVTLLYPPGSRPGPAGSGFLVPAVDGRLIKAATFLSRKWPELSAPGLLVRCSVGRYGEVRDVQRDDADLVAGAARELADAAGLTAPVVAGRVTRWGGALPQYLVGHPSRVLRLREAIARLPGLAVCGAAYDGVGVPACIRSARAAVAKVCPWAQPGQGWSAS